MSYIVIEGNIGCGKTSLAKRISLENNSVFIPEEFEHNPFLEFFYKEPEKYALATEYCFLLDRIRQLLKYDFKKNEKYCSDYSIKKCLWFAKMNLTASQFVEFHKNFEDLTGLLPVPDFEFFLHLPFECIMQNVEKRGRAIEKGISIEYLAELNKFYLKFSSEETDSKTKRINFYLKDNSPETYETLLIECLEILKSGEKKSQFSDHINL